MGKFDRGGFGGEKKFSGRDRSYDRQARPDMHKAICAECGSQCEVPFKPSGDRPVLCSACFKNSGRGDRGEEKRNFDRPRNEDKRMFDATCTECGARCQVPFKPRPDRDVFCDACFGREDKRDSKPFIPNQALKSVNYDKQFEALNFKLNKIIELLNAKPSIEAAKPAAVKPVEAAVKETLKTEVKKAGKKISAKKKASKKK